MRPARRRCNGRQAVREYSGTPLHQYAFEEETHDSVPRAHGHSDELRLRLRLLLWLPVRRLLPVRRRLRLTPVRATVPRKTVPRTTT